MIYTLNQAYHMAGIHHQDSDLVKDMLIEDWLGGRKAVIIDYTTDLESVRKHANWHRANIVIIKENPNVSKP